MVMADWGVWRADDDGDGRPVSPDRFCNWWSNFSRANIEYDIDRDDLVPVVILIVRRCGQKRSHLTKSNRSSTTDVCSALKPWAYLTPPCEPKLRAMLSSAQM